MNGQPIQSNFQRSRGDGYPIRLYLGEDVSGGTFLLTADPNRAPVDDSNNIFQLTGTVIDALNGVVEFSITPEEADHVGRFYYDVQMNRGGIPYTVAFGRIRFVQDITKD